MVTSAKFELMNPGGAGSTGHVSSLVHYLDGGLEGNRNSGGND